MIQKTRYVIAVQDLQKSAEFYRDVLGFEIHEIGDPGWRFYSKDDCLIMAGECPDDLPAEQLGCHSYFAYFNVDNVDEIYESLKSKNAEITKPLRSEPWGMREFGVRTIDGHRIMYGSPLEESSSDE